ncbi:MAG: hypothetical protein CMF74_16470 [Maricaulis sp.]|jgi:PKHD-type hydroxylase|nr:hypothetical protein [Maricaulis sp.]|tara:strand:+ start:470 stop:1057 length:588 start_codon:yes stop_codon:yes gene_type:complete
MTYRNIYWFYNKVIPERICDEIVAYFKNKKKIKALTGASKRVTKIRKSSIVFDQENLWIDHLINPFIRNANIKAGWNYQIDYAETHQFTEYKINQHYNWHIDEHDKPYESNDKRNNKIRKLSMSLCLSDKNSYDGGNLMFSKLGKLNKINSFTVKEMREKGSLIVFPSYTLHRVEPVTRGTRHSLVIWYLGNPYR